MKITFISNYINHHQIPFSEACYRQLGEDFCFIQTQEMEQERIAMGWHADGTQLPYVKCLYEEEALCIHKILESDILLAGWTNREDLISRRLATGRITIRISERLYREGQWKAISPRGLLRKYQDHVRYRKAPVFLLCAGAYVPSDFHLIHAYPNKMYRWGYFPETRHYSKEQWAALKPEGSVLEIVWAGRFLPLKHPEYMIRLARALKEEKDNRTREQNAAEIQKFTDFRIHMVGNGELEAELRREASQAGVQDNIIFYGFQEPERVREIMEKCHIHVFTSNQLEGWGAVVNEAMNSGCAEVASAQAGAVPYLIRQGINGLAYPDGDCAQMIQMVLFLAEHPEKIRSMGREAYQTITELWNAERAAGEVIRFSKALLSGRTEPADEGPFSPAPVVAPRRMYAWMQKESGKVWNSKESRY